jgi:glycine oxidase
MTHRSDILIIGGGISGLLSAKALLASGQSITILDKAQSGQEASWAGGGILLPLYPWRQPAAISSLVTNSLAQYPELSRELTHATGIDPEWLQCGLLISQNPDIEQATAWCKQYDIPYQAAETERFNQLNCDTENPLWLPSIAQARNPRLLKSLRAFLDNAGVRFVEHCDISVINHNKERITSIDTNLGTFEAEQVIATTGAWTHDFLTRFLPEQRAPAIRPVKGQMLLFEAKPDTLSCMVLDGDRYLIPRRDGRILAGSTVEEQGFDKTTTDHARNTLFTFATDLMPALNDYPVIAHWAGIRPGTHDGVPFIGKHPVLDNLFINAGHFRNGLVMGPASATLLADLILQRTPTLDPTPYQIHP